MIRTHDNFDTDVIALTFSQESKTFLQPLTNLVCKTHTSVIRLLTNTQFVGFEMTGQSYFPSLTTIGMIDDLKDTSNKHWGGGKEE